MDSMKPIADAVGRLLMSIIFIASGIGGIIAFQGTERFMEAHGLPAILLPPAIAVELVGGAMILVGYRTRLAALGLMGFTLVAAFVFHSDLNDLNERIMFLKNLAMAGGLAILFANGAGAWSLDGRRRR